MCNIRYADNYQGSKKTLEEDIAERRKYWNKAIANCYQLADWLYDIRENLKTDANKYDPYLKRIKLEINLLEEVKKAD